MQMHEQRWPVPEKLLWVLAASNFQYVGPDRGNGISSRLAMWLLHAVIIVL